MGFCELVTVLLLGLIGLVLGLATLQAGGTIIVLVNNRILRSRNIREQGWPPPHLDADGDWKKQE